MNIKTNLIKGFIDVLNLDYKELIPNGNLSTVEEVINGFDIILDEVLAYVKGVNEKSILISKEEFNCHDTKVSQIEKLLDIIYQLGLLRFGDRTLLHEVIQKCNIAKGCLRNIRY
jgi:hypothetical protein